MTPPSDRKLLRDFFTTLYLRQEWNDPRLTFDSPNRTVVVSHKRLSQLWVPDLFFPQAKEEKSHDLTTPNILIRLAPNGTVLYSMRLTLRLRCMMTLQKFPLDEQTCKIQLESYAYTLDDMELVWSAKRKRINVLPEAYLPDFRITNNETLVCEAEYETGRFPCLAATLTLQREIGYYMIQTYIPTILIVMLSWASFWIDHEAVPARISVGLLTVLTITTQGSGVLAQLPKVPYIKSIDVWMSTCLVFVFVSYMEYAVVAVLTRQYRKGVNQRRIYSQNSKRASSKSSISSSPEVKTNGVGPTLNDSSDTLYHSDENLALSFLSKEDYGRKLEKISRYLFPSSFIIFNLVYWTVYVYL